MKLKLTKADREKYLKMSENDIFWDVRDKLHFKNGWKAYLALINAIDSPKLDQLLKSEQWTSFQKELYKLIREQLDKAAAERMLKVKEALVSDGIKSVGDII